MAKKKIKCPVCEHMLIDPNDPRHIKSQKHQDALKKQGKLQKTLISPKESIIPTIKSDYLPKNELITTKLSALESRIIFLEEKFDKLVSPYKKIKLDDFKKQLFKEYSHLNPSKDKMSIFFGVNFDILKRRICRELEISYDYFEDLFYDLQKKEHIITIQAGRGKKYIQIKSNSY